MNNNNNNNNNNNPLNNPDLLFDLIFPFLFSSTSHKQIQYISCLSKFHWKQFHRNSYHHQRWWEWVASHFYLLHSIHLSTEFRRCENNFADLSWWLSRLTKFHGTHGTMLTFTDCGNCDEKIIKYLMRRILLWPKLKTLTYIHCGINNIKKRFCIANLCWSEANQDHQFTYRQGFMKIKKSSTSFWKNQHEWKLLAEYLERFTLADFELPLDQLKYTTHVIVWQHFGTRLSPVAESHCRSTLSDHHFGVLFLLFLVECLYSSSIPKNHWIYSHVSWMTNSKAESFFRGGFHKILKGTIFNSKMTNSIPFLEIWQTICSVMNLPAKARAMYRVDILCKKCLPSGRRHEINSKSSCVYCLFNGFETEKNNSLVASLTLMKVILPVCCYQDNHIEEEKTRQLLAENFRRTTIYKRFLIYHNNNKNYFKNEDIFFDTFLKPGIQLNKFRQCFPESLSELNILDMKDSEHFLSKWKSGETTRLNSLLRRCFSVSALFHSCIVMRYLGVDLNMLFDTERHQEIREQTLEKKKFTISDVNDDNNDDDDDEDEDEDEDDEDEDDDNDNDFD